MPARSVADRREQNKLKQNGVKLSKQFEFYINKMIPLSLNAQNYDQLVELFSNYINDINHVMNSLKKCIYELINLPLNPAQAILHPNMASVSAHGKKTLDDLKRIASVFRGYTRSKNLQKEEDSVRRSRIQNLSVSRNNHSRVSRQLRSNSEAVFSSKFLHPDDPTLNNIQIPAVTFELPFEQPPLDSPIYKQSFSKLNHYRSLRTLNKTSEVNNIEKLTQPEGEEKLPNNHVNISFADKSLDGSRKRARTSQKLGQSRISAVINETQTKFKQCLVKHESGMDDIIRRNTECLDILKDIQMNIRRKKQKKPKQAIQPREEAKKSVARYQSMTVSPKVQVKKT